jgi:hypothetical protein
MKNCYLLIINIQDLSHLSTQISNQKPKFSSRVFHKTPNSTAYLKQHGKIGKETHKIFMKKMNS